MKIEFINPFIESTIKTMKMMADVEVNRDNLALKRDLITTYDISAILSLTGQVEGSIILSMPKPLACLVAEKLVMEPYTELDGNVQDAVGELANIIVGDARRALVAMGHKTSLSIPNIILGTGHIISRRRLPCIAIQFRTDHGLFEINVGVKTSNCRDL